MKQDTSYWLPHQESELDGRAFIVLPGLPSAQMSDLPSCLASIYSDWAVPVLFWLLKLVTITFPLFTTNHILEVRQRDRKADKPHVLRAEFLSCLFLTKGSMEQMLKP